VLVVTDMTTGC